MGVLRVDETTEKDEEKEKDARDGDFFKIPYGRPKLVPLNHREPSTFDFFDAVF